MTSSISHFFQGNSTSSHPLYYIEAEGGKIKDLQLDLASQIHHLCFSVLSNFGSIMRPSFLDLCCQSKLCRCGFPQAQPSLPLAVSYRKEPTVSCPPRAPLISFENLGITVFLLSLFPPVSIGIYWQQNQWLRTVMTSPSLTIMPHWGIPITNSKYGNPTVNSPVAHHLCLTLPWCQRNNSLKSVSVLSLGGHLSLERNSALNLTFYWSISSDDHWNIKCHWEDKYSTEGFFFSPPFAS